MIRIGGEADRGLPGQFHPVDMTPEHLVLLSEIKSPWFALYKGGSDGERIDRFRNVLKSVSVAEIAEFTFVGSRPAAETRAVLARGRSVFSDAAMRFILTVLSLPTLQQIASHPELLSATIPRPGPGPGGGQKL